MKNKASWPEDKIISEVTDEFCTAAKSNVTVNVEFINQPKQKISEIINIKNMVVL